MTRRWRGPVAALMALLAGGLAESAEIAPATAHVTYLAGTSVYVDAGRREGLREGDTLEVVRDGAVIATLQVGFLADHRVSCTLLSSTAAPAVGDLVRFVPHGAEGGESPPPAAGAAPAGGATPASPRGGADTGLHGRIGVRYLAIRDRIGDDNGFHQPAADLRLEGSGIAGRPFDLAVDVRARRTYQGVTGGETVREDQNRVYRLSGTYRFPDSRQRLTVGRQMAPSLEALSIFDGLLYEAQGRRWGGGAFAGVQPEADLSYSGDIREYGGFANIHSAPGEKRMFGATLGLIGSYTEGTVNREFVYLQGRYRGPAFSAFLSEEVDYNRDWKVTEAGEPTWSATGTFAHVQLRATEGVTLYAGYDDRRNARIYRDRVTPATEFDDQYRQGGWAGASFRLATRFRIGADLRRSTGGDAGTADGYSGYFSMDQLTRAGLSFQARSLHYANDTSDGWTHTLGTGVNLGTRAHAELSYGRLDETSALDSDLDRSADWLGLDLDLLLGRRWFLFLSGESYRGDLEENDQIYAGVAWRF